MPARRRTDTITQTLSHLGDAEPLRNGHDREELRERDKSILAAARHAGFQHRAHRRPHRLGPPADRTAADAGPHGAGRPAVWEGPLAVALTVAGTWAVIRLGGRLYQNALLQIGPKLSIRQAWTRS